MEVAHNSVQEPKTQHALPLPVLHDSNKLTTDSERVSMILEDWEEQKYFESLHRHNLELKDDIAKLQKEDKEQRERARTDAAFRERVEKVDEEMRLKGLASVKDYREFMARRALEKAAAREAACT